MQIQVRNYAGQSHYTTPPAPVIEVIKRKPFARQIGNFNPLFTRYMGKTFQVHSDTGDLSDPFRRTQADTQTAFIDLSKPCAWN